MYSVIRNRSIVESAARDIWVAPSRRGLRRHTFGCGFLRRRFDASRFFEVRFFPTPSSSALTFTQAQARTQPDQSFLSRLCRRTVNAGLN